MPSLSDTAWNTAAFVIMALSGIVLNIAIARSFGAAGLGVFNQGMAVFVIAAHLASMGIHNAALRSVALEPAAMRTVVVSALAATAPFAVASAGAVFLAAPLLGQALDSPATGGTIAWLAPGVLLFGLNKVALAAFNGATLMRRYAVGQMTRYVSIGGVALAMCAADPVPDHLGLAFTVAEAILGLYLIAVFRTVGSPGPVSIDWTRMRSLLRFGSRSFSAGLLTELNIRVDALVLGLFASDSEVGVYAFIALIVEGLCNVSLVLKTIVNPHLARKLAQGDLGGVRVLLARIQLGIYPLVAVAIVAAWMLYRPVVDVIVAGAGLERGLTPLLVLLALMFPYFGLCPFEDTLMMSGRATAQSVYQASIVGVNVTLNLVLVPTFGILGAAIATGLASLYGCMALLVSARSLTGHWLLAWPAGKKRPLGRSPELG